MQLTKLATTIANQNIEFAITELEFNEINAKAYIYKRVVNDTLWIKTATEDEVNKLFSQYQTFSVSVPVNNRTLKFNVAKWFNNLSKDHINAYKKINNIPTLIGISEIFKGDPPLVYEDAPKWEPSEYVCDKIAIYSNTANMEGTSSDIKVLDNTSIYENIVLKMVECGKIVKINSDDVFNMLLPYVTRYIERTSSF